MLRNPLGGQQDTVNNWGRKTVCLPPPKKTSWYEETQVAVINLNWTEIRKPGLKTEANKVDLLPFEVSFLRCLNAWRKNDMDDLNLLHFTCQILLSDDECCLVMVCVRWKRAKNRQIRPGMYVYMKVGKCACVPKLTVGQLCERHLCPT